MPARRSFDPAEDDYIRANYRSSLYRDIGVYLGRSEAAIAHRVQDLGLSKVAIRRWTEAEDQVIRDGVGRELRAVAAELGRHRNEVSERSRALGLGPWRKRAGYKSVRGHKVREYVRKNGYSARVLEHRAVMAERLGRDLADGEVVHHVDLDKANNGLGNLHLCAGVAEHMRAHRSLEKLVAVLLERGVVCFNRTEGIYELCESSK